MSASVEIVAEIDGRRVSRAEVLTWEARCAAKVLRKLGARARSAMVVEQRRALVERKLELGRDAIERLLRRDLALSGLAGSLAARSARRKLCTIELHGRGGSAEIVPQFYADALGADDEAPLLAACPHHYIIRTRGDGLQEIVETPGGSPLAVRIVLDETDLSTLTSQADPTFPVQWVGVARDANGQAIGGIRHQFRDDEDGFRARLTAELPAMLLPHMIDQHRWHLACEFSNWLEAANRAQAGTKAP
jgi:hypothetical protein